jgi:hypothetical protein
MARSARITRKTQLGRRAPIQKQLLKLFESVTAGWDDQVDRANETLDWWDQYHCKLGSKQDYSGRAKLFVPLVHNGIEARKTRFLNQLFPQAGRYIEVTTEDGEIPHAEMALIEGYVEAAKLKTDVVPAMLVQGDVEGGYSLCVTWGSRVRHVVSRETSPVRIGGIDHPEQGQVTRIKEEDITDERPQVDLIPDADLLILPHTSETAEAAIEAGGSVTTICRWTRSRVESLIDSEEIDKELAHDLLSEWENLGNRGPRDPAKAQADVAGIKAGGKFVLVYRTWAKIEVEDTKRLVLAYYAGDGQILGCKLCPYWSDKMDILSRPVRKMPGVAKGASLVKPCADMQYLANDFANMGADSGIFTVNPVILTDPEKNPRYGSMVLDNMAVWEASPQSTQPLAFPPVYQHAFNVIQAAERYIMATLSVNAAMLPQSTGVPGRKRNQAEIAMEQQIDLLSTSVEISAAEAVLTEVVQRFAELDAQFRDDEITVRSVGELGVKAQMQTVPPLQMGRRWRFRWFGVEAARTAQQIQQQIALLNVLKPISQDPSVQQAGYQLNLVPFVRTVTENAFGPRLAPEIFKNIRDQLALDPELENSMLAEGFEVPTSPQDDDPKHIQAHLAAAQQTMLEPARSMFAHHLAAHQRQMQMKQVAQHMQQMMKQMQARGGGAPGGAGAAPRGPAPGGQPAMPRQGRQPPGAVPPDSLNNRGIVQMPRRM